MSDQLITTRLELVKYHRISLNGFTSFVYTPDSRVPLQIILGTNGSGKSSLTYELWPLPGDAWQFGEGGKKDHEFTYKGETWRIVGHFDGTKKGKYEFWRGDKNLLGGEGKIEMCRALCMEHFGVNNEIRNLALELEPLTSMGPARRRYWMVKLADSDFAYAMQVYNKLKEAHRDASGSVRRMQKRLVDETAKLVDKNVADDIATEVKSIKELITELYGIRNSQAEDSSSVLLRLDSTKQAIDAAIAGTERINVEQLGNYGFEDRETLVGLITKAASDETAVQALNQRVFSDHQRIDKKWELLRKSGTESIAELQVRHSSLSDQATFITKTLTYQDVAPLGSAREARETFTRVFQDLIEGLTHLPINDGKFSSAKAQELNEQNRSLGQQHYMLSRSHYQLVLEVQHARSHRLSDEIQCPKCQHKWNSKATDEELSKMDVKIQEMATQIATYEATIEKNKEYLKEYAEYDAAFRNVHMMLRNCRAVGPYIARLTEGNRLMTQPNSVGNDLYSVDRDLEKLIEVEDIHAEMKKVDGLIELKKNMDADTIEDVEKELARLETELSTTTAQLGHIRSNRQHYESVLQLSDRIDARRQELEELHQTTKDLGKEYVYSRYQETLQYAIMGLQTQLARKEDALSAILSQQALVDDIQYQIEETQMQERVAKAAHQALSPTTGAIAEGLRKFNNIFVDRMNKVINAIWSYPLEIKACQLDDGQVEMDYKFPFEKNREGRVLDDVVEGSKSMVAIFNFAFRMRALRQLGLGHLPLFLDEFEAAFDVAHREAAIYFVKKLLDENHYGQIFMISHYESNHGALSSLSQTCVLNDQNVMLGTDTNINQNAEFS
jgi:hypothetical protein